MKLQELIAVLKSSEVVPQLVGNDVKLVGKTAALPPDIISNLKAQKNELIAFLRKANDRTAFTPIEPIPVQQNYPASNAQKRIWLLTGFKGGSTAYNIVKGFILLGPLVKENIDKAFQFCIQRHEILRTTFKEADGEIKQVISADAAFQTEFVDISGIADCKSYLRSAIEVFNTTTFDLEQGPLVRARLYKISEEEHAILIALHHIISDGWSLRLLIHEMLVFYKALCRNEKTNRQPLRIQYKDYCNWLNQKNDGIQGQHAMNFWRSYLSGDIEPLNLNTAMARGKVRSFDGGRIKYYFDENFYSSVLSFCKQHQVTIFNFFRATVTILLYKFSGQYNITIGSPVSGRNHFELENQMGLYVNTLPLTIDVNAEDAFIEFLRRLYGDRKSVV